MSWQDLATIVSIIGAVGGALMRFIHWSGGLVQKKIVTTITEQTGAIAEQSKANSTAIKSLSDKIDSVAKTVTLMEKEIGIRTRGTDDIKEELISTLKAERTKTIAEFERSRVEWENDFVGRLKTILAKKSG